MMRIPLRLDRSATITFKILGKHAVVDDDDEEEEEEKKKPRITTKHIPSEDEPPFIN